MSQPALSHQIAALEKELGTPVAHRLGRGVRVTAAGLHAAEQVVHKGRQVGTGTGGRLRIACAETMTTWVLVPVLRQWRSRRPEVGLDLSEHTSADEVLALIGTGAVDLAIGPRPAETDEHVDVLGQEELVAIAPTGHRFADAPSVSFADLADEPFVHYAPENGLAGWLDELAAAHRVVLDLVLRTRSPRTVAQLAAAGMGVTIVPVSALATRPPGVVRPLEPPLHRDVVVVVASPSDTLAARFVADLRRRGLP